MIKKSISINFFHYLDNFCIQLDYRGILCPLKFITLHNKM
jgi:hypothetical protein